MNNELRHPRTIRTNFPRLSTTPRFATPTLPQQVPLSNLDSGTNLPSHVFSSSSPQLQRAKLPLLSILISSKDSRKISILLICSKSSGKVCCHCLRHRHLLLSIVLRKKWADRTVRYFSAHSEGFSCCQGTLVELLSIWTKSKDILKAGEMWIATFIHRTTDWHILYTQLKENTSSFTCQPYSSSHTLKLKKSMKLRNWNYFSRWQWQY